MLYLFIEVLFKGVGYSMILYAFWLIVGNSFYNTYVKASLRNFQKRRRIKRLRELEREIEKPEKESSISKHLEVVLRSIGKSENVSVSNFVMLSLIIFIVSTILLFILVEDLFFSIIIGLLFGISPYLFSIYRLEVLRLKTSLAFINEFHIILQNYQSTNKNIYYTLLNTVQDLNDKHIKQQFRKLISSLQKERQEKDFKEQVHIFVYSINSTFAKRFGNLIIKAHLDNADIGGSLTNLGEDITHRKKDMEDEKTQKLQTVMIGFAPIVVFPLMLFFAYQISGVVDFWFYFKQKTSLVLFMICLLSSVISILLAFLIRKPKADV